MQSNFINALSEQTGRKDAGTNGEINDDLNLKHRSHPHGDTPAHKHPRGVRIRERTLHSGTRQLKLRMK